MPKIKKERIYFQSLRMILRTRTSYIILLVKTDKKIALERIRIEFYIV